MHESLQPGGTALCVFSSLPPLKPLRASDEIRPLSGFLSPKAGCTQPVRRPNCPIRRTEEQLLCLHSRPARRAGQEHSLDVENQPSTRWSFRFTTTSNSPAAPYARSAFRG